VSDVTRDPRPRPSLSETAGSKKSFLADEQKFFSPVGGSHGSKPDRPECPFLARAKRTFAKNREVSSVPWRTFAHCCAQTM